MLKFNPNTPVNFYSKETIYTPGEGSTAAWKEVIKKPLYCEWRGTFGDRALSAEALGVKDSATVRTFYHPEVYEKLRSVQVIIVRNRDDTAFLDGEPDKNNPNVFELWGGVDNVKEENHHMVFRVRRYEGK
mgnify:CR=1 FL=1